MERFTNRLKLKKEHLKTSFLLLFSISALFVTSPVWAGFNKWTTNGPYGTAIKDIAISPNFANDSTVITTTPKGIYKSVDGGNS